MKDGLTYTRYVVGFVFRPNGDVLLIQKQKPDWQAGKLNGVGGKLKVFESPMQAMRREFKEETGVLVRGWTRYCVLIEHRREGMVYCFYANNGLEKWKQMEAEKLIWIPSRSLPETVLPDLKWLIPMACSGTGCYANVQQA